MALVTAKPNIALTMIARTVIEWPEDARVLEDVLRKDFKRLALIATEVAIETGPPTGAILARLLREEPDCELAIQLTRGYPDFLFDLSLEAAKQCLIHPSLAGPNFRSSRAKFLTTIANHHIKAGARTESKEAAEEALEICEQLVDESHDDKRMVQLVQNLSDLASCFFELAEHEQSMRVWTRMQNLVERCISQAANDKTVEEALVIFGMSADLLIQLKKFDLAVVAAQFGLNASLLPVQKAASLLLLVEALVGLGQRKEADEVAGQLVHFCQLLPTPKSSMVRHANANILGYCANSLRLVERFCEADSVASMALQMFQALPPHWRTGRQSLFMLAIRAFCQHKLKNPEIAFSLIREAQREIGEASGSVSTHVREDLAATSTYIIADFIQQRAIEKALKAASKSKSLFDDLPGNSRPFARLALCQSLMFLSYRMAEKKGGDAHGLMLACDAENVFLRLPPELQRDRKEVLVGVLAALLLNQLWFANAEPAIITAQQIGELLKDLKMATELPYAFQVERGFTALMSRLSDDGRWHLLCRVIGIVDDLLISVRTSDFDWQRLRDFTATLRR